MKPRPLLACATTPYGPPLCDAVRTMEGQSRTRNKEVGGHEGRNERRRTIGLQQGDISNQYDEIIPARSPGSIFRGSFKAQLPTVNIQQFTIRCLHFIKNVLPGFTLLFYFHFILFLFYFILFYFI